jgi:hypothetical protein
MSKPKHKEVTFWVAGIDNSLSDRKDRVIVVEATFIETEKQYRLKKEDSKEFRFAARFLHRAVFDKKNHKLCATKKDALVKLRDYFMRSTKSASLQAINYARLGNLVLGTMLEADDA